MKHLAATAFMAAEFGACVAVFTPIMGASWLAHRGDPTQRIPGRWMRRLGRTISTLSPLWSFDVAGTPPADVKTRPYVVIANHQSNADPFLLSSLPWDMRWVQKAELYKMPVIGMVFRFSGDVVIRRGEAASVRSMMDACRAAIDAGISVMIFPEGKRSKTGELLPFRDGAFQLAVDTGTPVLPVAISGTRDCLLKGPPWVGRAKATATILEPIEPAPAARNPVAELRDRSRESIARALGLEVKKPEQCAAVA